MFRACVIGVAVLAASACRDEGLVELEELKDEVCACKTPACGEAAIKRTPQEGIEKNHRSRQIARDMLDCMAALYKADRPTTDPDAEQPAPAGSAAPAPPQP
jgi:hypothetical protein